MNYAKENVAKLKKELGLINCNHLLSVACIDKMYKFKRLTPIEQKYMHPAQATKSAKPSLPRDRHNDRTYRPERELDAYDI